MASKTKPKPGVWGIDLGQCALKAVRLEERDGTITATAFDYVEYPKILTHPDAEPEQLIREALEKFLSRNTLKGDHVAVGVPGQSGLARFVKLPPVEEKKIPEIVKFEARQQIPFPLEEVVWDYQRINAGTVTDNFAMETEVGIFAMKRDMISRYLGFFQAVGLEVHTIQMTPLALSNYLAYDVLAKTGPAIAEGGVAPSPPEDTPRGKKRCVVALDIGTESSALVISDGEKVIWQRPIPLGGDRFTKALTRELKLTLAKAEHVKRNAAKSADLAKILKALKPVLNDFVNEVQRSLGYFTNSHRDAHVAYMIGLGNAFKLPGFQKFLAEKLGLDVRKPGKHFERLTGEAVTGSPVFTENVLTFPIAYGLAIQGMGYGRITTNLLPEEITIAREIRAKKPYAAAAAALVLLGSFVMAFGYSAEWGAVTDPKLQAAIKTGESAIQAASSQNAQINSKKSEVEETQLDVKSIIAGQDERLNWIELNEYISRNLPRPPGLIQRPDGGFDLDLDPRTSDSNLLGEEQKAVWNKQDADFNGPRAIIEYWKRVQGLVDADGPSFNEEDPDQAPTDQFGVRVRKSAGSTEGLLAAVEPISPRLKRSLPTVDLEAINARYTNDLAEFYKTATTTMKVEPGSGLQIDFSAHRDPRDPTRTDKKDPLLTPPKGGGWVVELRGVTYHAEETEFLVSSLVRLLQDDIGGRKRVRSAATKDGPEDPIKGKVSHAFLYAKWETPGDGPPYSYIGQSKIDQLLAASMGGMAGGEGGMPGMGRGGPGLAPAGVGGTGGGGGGEMGGEGDDFGGAAGASSPDANLAGWVPITGAGAVGGYGEGYGGEGGPGGMTGGFSGMRPGGARPGGGRPGGLPPGLGLGSPGGRPGPGGGRFSGEGEGGPMGPSSPRGSGPTRTEFVVIFFWKEPLSAGEQGASDDDAEDTGF